MRDCLHPLTIAVSALALLMSACATPGGAPRPTVAPAVQAPVTDPAAPRDGTLARNQPDPIRVLIDASQAHFDRGQTELQLGHLDRAKAAFDQSLDVLLESPSGARANPRIQEHFDRLVDRISAFEVRALVQGDGFTEQPELPASLDDLLALSTVDLPAAKPELRAAVATDLQSTIHDIPIPVNAKVLSYIELFQGRLRDWFQATLQRGQPYIPMIQGALRAEGLPIDLAFVPMVESAFHTSALSRAKAKGFWQLMRGTAVEQGLKHDWYIDERANPEKATQAAVRYLRFLHKRFNGDWHLALASYNVGYNKVRRAVKRSGITDYWTLAERRSYLPRETKQYVPMLLAAIVVARNPAQYGFTTEPAAVQASETVTLLGPVDLRRIAEWAGVAVDEIQSLNPELRRLTTPLRGEGYELRVPVGTSAVVAEKLASFPPEDLTPFQYHAVKRGESITSIANKLRVRRADLAEANYLTIRSRVKPGDRLVIPRASTTLLSARAERPAPAPPVRAVTATASGAANGNTPRGGRAKVTYRVRKGDTLSSIARAFNTTIDALREWNGLKGSRLMPGDKLTVYTNREPGQH